MIPASLSNLQGRLPRVPEQSENRIWGISSPSKKFAYRQELLSQRLGTLRTRKLRGFSHKLRVGCAVYAEYRFQTQATQQLSQASRF